MEAAQKFDRWILVNPSGTIDDLLSEFFNDKSRQWQVALSIQEAKDLFKQRKKMAKAKVDPRPKAEIIREWWTNAQGEYTSKTSEPLVAEYLASKGHEFKAGDKQTNLRAGQAAGKLKLLRAPTDKKSTVVSTPARAGEVSLKNFAEMTSDIDPAVLANAIKVIGHVGGVDKAEALAKKWADLCDAIGEANAKKAIEVL